MYSGQANFDGQHEYDVLTGGIVNTNGVYLAKTTAVGSYGANRWGLYDMIGNTWEWCQDWRGDYPPGPVTDPQGAESGLYRVYRGGSSVNYGECCRSAQRDGSPPNFKSRIVGIRVVLAAVPTD